ncbi:hypothetical protein [Clostridium polynesiense]|uniref:hypothetical protein n=1 Tax=Clostridium polynesiense TaxID=1325933 RepID=UPI00058D8797|nr:hypothetical protein [Clostridium polynesiense]
MYYYKINENILISEDIIPNYKKLKEEEIKAPQGNIFFAMKKPPLLYRSIFKIYDEDILNYSSEGVELLNRNNNHLKNYPKWIYNAMEKGDAYFINTGYPLWMDFIKDDNTKKSRYDINVIGLGDVGGILSSGLKLLGEGVIGSIGLYDRNENKVIRWKNEISSIIDINETEDIKVKALNEDEIFNCDVLVFCVSVGVPEINASVNDVRMVQFQGNKDIISHYAKEARIRNFSGIFAVVSDPVDLLCKAVFLESNKDLNGNYDFKGIPSHRIRGYGLGVMNARAKYYSESHGIYSNYDKEGRVFGPHGEGLIAANSISNYNSSLSEAITSLTKNANLEVRASGFKPYIAPALSSGAISIIATLKEDWHYASTFLGGIFMGTRCRYNEAYGTILEKYNLPQKLFKKLKETEAYLHNLY